MYYRKGGLCSLGVVSPLLEGSLDVLFVLLRCLDFCGVAIRMSVSLCGARVIEAAGEPRVWDRERPIVRPAVPTAART